jgi:hypothetical protein
MDSLLTRAAMPNTRRRLIALASGFVAASGLVAAARPALARSGDGDSVPNVFVSPHGRPFRAPAGAPYPVVDWFRAADRNGDGKLDRDEFVADAAAFFAFLDMNGDGALDGADIDFYEHRIAPEVLGVQVTVYADGRMRAAPDGPRLWLAQFGQGSESPGPFQGGALGQDDQSQGPSAPGGPGQPTLGGDPHQGEIVPHDALPQQQPRQGDSGLGEGAAPYGLFQDPEPVTAGDPDYVTSAVVRKARFLAHARANFDALDRAHAGYLTLAGLPQTPVQRLLRSGGRSG